jgi:ribosomal protein S18 acetylase RimI-like enzyme
VQFLVDFVYDLAKSRVSSAHAHEAQTMTTEMGSTPQDLGAMVPWEAKDLEVRKLEFHDLKRVAQLHADVFPDYFLTHLGQEMLQIFYSGFVDRDLMFSSVVVINGKIVGFVVGMADSQAFFDRFYSNYFYFILKHVSFHFFADKVIRRDIHLRINHIKRALLAKFFQKTTTTTNDSKISTRLLSIGIHSEYRGRGIAELLTGNFIQQVAAAEIDRIGLSVLKNNPRAVAFYEKTGWLRELETSNTVLFWRLTKDLLRH